jgi:class 3 adenylate cyclase
LESFYGRAGQIVGEHGGVIDKFIGDELMAMFFAYNTEPEKGSTSEARTETACRAVDCARGLLNAFRELELKFKKALTLHDDVIPDIEWTLKIGMEAGSLRILEQVLPNGELEYCAVGPAINFASRVKGLATGYSVSFGQGVFTKLTNDPLYRCEPIAVPDTLKGIDPKSLAYKLTKC